MIYEIINKETLELIDFIDFEVEEKEIFEKQNPELSLNKLEDDCLFLEVDGDY